MTDRIDIPFSKLDSFALWDVPKNIEKEISNPDNIEKAFKDTYKENYFPDKLLKKQLPDLEAALTNMKYVLVGINPGNAAANQPATSNFLAFHGPKTSKDYRIAAATFGTEVWGSLMTNLSDKITSQSSDIKIDQTLIDAFEKHLTELGVPASAKIIALGKGLGEKLKEFEKRQVFFVMGYSSRNNGSRDNDWNILKARSVIEEIVKTI